MAQFDVYENLNPELSQLIPYFLDVQANLLSDLNTRVVVPLYLPEAIDNRVVERLAPVLSVRGKPYVALTPELAGIPASELGIKIANVANARNEVVSAIDLLITGI